MNADARDPGVLRCIEVAAGLVFRDGALLIAQRHAHAHLGGLWEFPGGKLEPGESYEQCLVRELLEELGIEVEVGTLFDEIVHDYPGKRVRLRFFRCKWTAREPHPHGCETFRWVKRGDLGRYDFPPADVPVVRKLIDRPAVWEQDQGSVPGGSRPV